jgi:single-stranded DNA-binding protein
MSSLFALATGALIANPQRREGQKGPFATAIIRVAGNDGEATLISGVAFGDEATRLLELSKGDAISLAGRAKLSSWVGRDGEEKHGISIVIEQIAAAKPRRRTDTEARGSPAGVRRHYPAPAARDAGSPLPRDPLDDLYTDRGLIP